MRGDLVHSPKRIPTAFKDVPQTVNARKGVQLWGMGLGPKGEDVLLGQGADYAEATAKASARVATDYPGRILG